MHGAYVLNACCRRTDSGGLQRHTALRARAWFGLAHLGIHRTDVYGFGWLNAFRSVCRVCFPVAVSVHMPGVLAKKLVGFFCKLGEAVLAAEVIGLPVNPVPAMTSTVLLMFGS
jgi:hypothetical protein